MCVLFILDTVCLLTACTPQQLLLNFKFAKGFTHASQQQDMTSPLISLIITKVLPYIVKVKRVLEDVLCKVYQNIIQMLMLLPEREREGREFTHILLFKLFDYAHCLGHMCTTR